MLWTYCIRELARSEFLNPLNRSWDLPDELLTGDTSRGWQLFAAWVDRIELEIGVVFLIWGITPLSVIDITIGYLHQASCHS
jgi:hypothetical protein